MSLDDLVREVRRAVEGEPLTGRWRRDLDVERRNWMGGKSNNLPRLAAACWAAEEPLAAANWWVPLLRDEWGGPLPWDAQEPRSRTYSGDTWVAELSARSVLARELENHPVLELLDRSLRRRAADAALCAVPIALVHGGRGQVIYRGFASLATGGRSNHHANHPADHVAHRVLTGTRPPVEMHQTELTRLALSLMVSGGSGWAAIDPGEREELASIARVDGGERASVERAVALLGPARTAAPVWTRRYSDGTVACGIDWNPSSNTSCTFLVVGRLSGQPLALDRDVAYLHPYGEHGRVRGGTKLGDRILGRGQTWWTGDRFCCKNLTAPEEKAKNGESWQLCHQLPPIEELLWELRMGPDGPPNLWFSAAGMPRPVEGPPPVAPDPVPPRPPTTPPAPPHAGSTSWLGSPSAPARHLVELIDPVTGTPRTAVAETRGPGSPLVVTRGHE